MLMKNRGPMGMLNCLHRQWRFLTANGLSGGSFKDIPQEIQEDSQMKRETLHVPLCPPAPTSMKGACFVGVLL